jgi:hypothetical protein
MRDGVVRTCVRARPGKPTLHEHVRARLGALISLFGLDMGRGTVLGLFDDICSESLDVPHERRSLRWSRINADGTPIQFGLALGNAGPVLQFLSEPARSDAPNAVRLRKARRCIRGLANALGVGTLEDVTAWLDVVAPACAEELLASDAGPIWLGAGFASAVKPKVKIYVNAKWGPHSDRWSRLAALAGVVGAAPAWQTLQQSLHPNLEPLGMGITIAPGAPLQGRIYLRGERMSFSNFEYQATACGAVTVALALPALRETLLANDIAYAARSAVCSFGLQADAKPSFKLECCGHCAFASDLEARTRCTELLARIGVDATPYVAMLEVLSDGAMNEREVQVHAHVGMAEQQGALCPTFYFNPAPAV